MKTLIILIITASAIVLSALSPHVMLNPGQLSQGHIKNENDCSSCHKMFNGVESERCIKCHKVEEIGLNKFKQDSAGSQKEIVLFHSKLKDLNCSSCHTDHKGRDPKLSVAGFNHNLLPQNIVAGCNRCHAAPADSLHRFVSINCSSCHNTNRWQFEGRFDHNQIKGVAKNNCTACHAKPLDRFHEDLSDNCDKCHSVDKWVPSTFDHSSYFILDRHHNVKCSTCHTTNDSKLYTCYGCHEHSEAKIRQEHLEEGITNYTDCASCHRSGDKHDLKKGGERRNGMEEDADKVRDYIRNGERKKSGHNEHEGEH